MLLSDTVGFIRDLPHHLIASFRATLEEVRQAVAALPEKQRAAVLMHKYEEMEYSQIANVLECSESAVKSLLFRAYETLRARLAHLNAQAGGSVVRAEKMVTGEARS